MVTEANERPDHALTVETSDGPAGDSLEATRSRFQTAQSFWSTIHAEALEDDRFVGGKQWPAHIETQRREDGRPCLTYNMFPSFQRQIVNKYRQERQQLKVRPVESDRHPPPHVKNVQGTQDYSLADIYSGIIRNIEHVSRADQAYDTALAHAVDHGFGFFLLENTWSKVDPFVQELRIRRVRDSYSVLPDPSAEEADYSDMQDCFLFKMMRRTTFAEKYGDQVAPTSYDGIPAHGSLAGWWDSDAIRIAQYYWIEWRDDEVVMLSNGKIVYVSETEDVLDDLERELGIHVQDDERGREMRKKVKRPICRWQKMTGVDILEGPIDLPFEHVPVFPVLGDERVVDGQVAYESATRHAKDAQRSYNYWRTAAAETVALSPRAPFVATERQIQGHEHLYETANTENHPVLTYNHVEGIPPPKRDFPNNQAVAELQLATQDARDMMTIIGLHEASLGAESNEKSGRAIERRREQGLTSTFQFPDNLARAQEHMGRVLVYAIPRIYDTRRVVRIRLPDDSEDFVEINQSVTDEESGRQVLVHDIAVGRYDVVMDTGIDYATQRQEARDTQLELLKLVGPEKAGQIVHKVIENIGGPGADKIAGVLRKLLPDELKSDEERRADLPPGVVLGEGGQPVNEETGEPWQPPLTPQQQLMQRQQEIDEAKVKAEMAKANADTEKANADVKKAEADLAEAQAKLAELERGPEGEEARDGAQFLKDVEQIVQRAMTEHEQNPNAHKAVHDELMVDHDVEVLRRVKAYVDRVVKQAAQRQPGEASGSETARTGTED